MGGGGANGGGGGARERITSPARRRQQSTVVDVRESAISEIKAREAASPLAGIGLGGMGTAVRNRMISELEAGGTPVTTIMNGKQVTVGVVGRGMFGDKAYTGRPGFDPIAARAEGREIGEAGKVTGTIMMPAANSRSLRLPSQEGDDSNARVTPEVTPEVVPEETVLGSATATNRRRTKSQRRLGGGGTVLEGYGALYK